MDVVIKDLNPAIQLFNGDDIIFNASIRFLLHDIVSEVYNRFSMLKPQWEPNPYLLPLF